MLGAIFFVVGFVILFVGHSDDSAVRMTYFAIEGMGCIIVGAIFMSVGDIIECIKKLDNKH